MFKNISCFVGITCLLAVSSLSFAQRYQYPTSPPPY